MTLQEPQALRRIYHKPLHLRLPPPLPPPPRPLPLLHRRPLLLILILLVLLLLLRVLPHRTAGAPPPPPGREVLSSPRAWWPTPSKATRSGRKRCRTRGPTEGSRRVRLFSTALLVALLYYYPTSNITTIVFLW